MVAVRNDERRAALAMLGADAAEVVRLGLPDGDVAAHEGVLARTLVSPWRHDRHLDHEACGRASSRAALAVRATRLEVPIWAWHAANVAGAGYGALLGGIVQFDGAIAEVKRMALGCFESQLVPLRPARGPILPPGFFDAFGRGFEPVVR